MNQSKDIKKEIAAQIKDAYATKTALSIRAGGSKDFYGRNSTGELFDVSAHSGITEYDPRELVITARAGTPLNEIKQRLLENRQMLAFEPPVFTESSTIGGTIACGLSGPRRAYTGSARDFVLGINCINGKGEQLSFGGQVIKNVAGYDVSRLMTGAMGTLGVITEISLKVLPVPAAEVTLQHECGEQDYLKISGNLGKSPAPVSASCYHDGKMYIRLSGSEQAVNEAETTITGTRIDNTDAKLFWRQVRNHQHVFFTNTQPLWRLSVPADTVILQLEGKTFYDWGGALRWICCNENEKVMRSLCESHGGHATLFRGGDRDENVFQPLDNGIAAIHKSLKTAFDPMGILNPGRMYKEF